MKADKIQMVIDAIVARENSIYDVVYFCGDAKTIQAALKEAEHKYAEHHPEAVVIREDAADFYNTTMRNLQEGRRSALYYDCDLYIFSRINLIAGREVNEQRLYGILDWLLEHGRQIIVTGSEPTEDISRLAPRIRAQLDGGVALRLEAD